MNKRIISISPVVHFWNGFGLKPCYEAPTKIFKETVRKVTGLIDGTLFAQMGSDESRKYAMDEIYRSIWNFAKAAVDKDYGPALGTPYQSKLKSTHLAQFIYNPFAHKHKSLFFYYLNNPPELLRNGINEVEDLYPAITRRLKWFYVNKILGGLDVSYSLNDEYHFRKAARRTKDFFSKHRGRMQLQAYGVVSDVHLADLVCEAMEYAVKGNLSIIRPSWFASDNMLRDRLPKYLIDEGILENW